MSTKLDEFAHIADILNIMNNSNNSYNLNVLAEQSFRILKKKRTEMFKISNFNSPGVRETFNNRIKKTYNSKMIPDMKIVIVHGVPKIFSRYS